MVATAAQISVVLSGGSENTDPSFSLGGNPSSTAINIAQTLNNIFDDVSPAETEDGIEDYRCFYIFNDAEDAAVYDIKLWLTGETAEGSYVEMGIQGQDEVQRFTITGTATGGSFEVGFGGQSFVSTYNADLGAWASALETGLNSLTDDDDEPLLTGVVVNAQNTSSGIVFDIQFSSYDGKRIQDELTVDSSLTPGSVTMAVTTLQNGAPINTIAPAIDVETTTPGSVEFFTPSEESPIEVPRLEPTEGFPVWVRRVVEAGATAVSDDGFSIRIRMSALKPE